MFFVEIKKIIPELLSTTLQFLCLFRFRYFFSENFAAKSGLTNLAFPVSGNVIYTQWNLGGLNIMIRCSQHGNIKDATHKVKNMQLTAFLLKLAQLIG